MKLFTSITLATRCLWAIVIFVVAANVHVTNAIDGYGPLPSEVSVGDEICVYGFVMDRWCIVDTGGTLLDNPSVVTLLNPEMHSFHCLLDVSVCNSSPYYILVPPSSGETMYSTGWQLSSNDLVQTAGRELGSQASGCSTCAETGTQAKGFRAAVTGTVVSTTDPPILDVLSVTALEGDAVGCMEGSTSAPEGEGEMMDLTKSPTMAPAVAVVISTEMPADDEIVVGTSNSSLTTNSTLPTDTPSTTATTDSPTFHMTTSAPTNIGSTSDTGSVPPTDPPTTMTAAAVPFASSMTSYWMIGISFGAASLTSAFM